MERIVIVDTNAFSHPIIPSKRIVAQRAALTLAELFTIPTVTVILDHREAFADRVDDDLILRAQCDGAYLCTGDTELQGKARAAGVRVIVMQDLDRLLQRTSWALADIFPHKQEIAPAAILPVRISKRGQYEGQGIGFLPDGRAVVVNGGAPFIGTVVDVVVEYIHHSPTGVETVFAITNATEKSQSCGKEHTGAGSGIPTP
jgi:uncharacterized protein YacL